MTVGGDGWRIGRYGSRSAEEGDETGARREQLEQKKNECLVDRAVSGLGTCRNSSESLLRCYSAFLQWLVAIRRNRYLGL